MKRLAIFLIVVLAGGCGEFVPEAEVRVPSQRFPADEVCGYPQRSIVKRFQRLGTSASWQLRLPATPDGSYACLPLPTADELSRSGDDLIEVRYAAAGDAAGAEIVDIVYEAVLSGTNSYEPQYRNTFATFTEEMILAALGEPAPDLVRKKLVNLETYTPLEKDLIDRFDVGSGFMTIARRRSADNSVIVAEVRLYADRNLKLR